MNHRAPAAAGRGAVCCGSCPPASRTGAASPDTGS